MINILFNTHTPTRPYNYFIRTVQFSWAFASHYLSLSYSNPIKSHYSSSRCQIVCSLCVGWTRKGIVAQIPASANGPHTNIIHYPVAPLILLLLHSPRYFIFVHNTPITMEWETIRIIQHVVVGASRTDPIHFWPSDAFCVSKAE